jgi:hypothetical protein
VLGEVTAAGLLVHLAEAGGLAGGLALGERPPVALLLAGRRQGERDQLAHGAGMAQEPRALPPVMQGPEAFDDPRDQLGGDRPVVGGEHPPALPVVLPEQLAHDDGRRVCRRGLPPSACPDIPAPRTIGSAEDPQLN